MFIRASSALAAVALLAGHAAAKTDIAGCVSSQTVAYGGASLIWYLPDTGEICEFLDCGGGRAPPKTTVPGCPQYDGTATYSPSYLPGFGAATTPTSSTQAVATESSTLEDSSSPRSTTGSASGKASITSPPATAITGTVTSSGPVQTQTGLNSDLDSSSSTTGSASTESSTNSVSTGGAVLPTAAIKGAFGVIAGIAAGAIML
ncbi:hypothetical protein GGR58DRAFT_394992 [Xylaria digitata]|nr:hypothetical protein GGR58DRAFT_394992 [Xylaria digitata]